MNKDFKQEIESIDIPELLSVRSRIGVHKAKSEMKGKIRNYVRNKVMAGVLAVTLILPTSVFAFQSLLVDEFYISFENLKQHISTATMEGYMLLNAKLTQAQGDLSKEEFKEFKELLKVLSTAKLEYANEYGHIDFSLMSTEELEAHKKIMLEIQPYFDKLNDVTSSKNILTSAEYEQYIDALITHEQIMAQSGVENFSDYNQIPKHLQQEFARAQTVIWNVYDKQLEQ